MSIDSAKAHIRTTLANMQIEVDAHLPLQSLSSTVGEWSHFTAEDINRALQQMATDGEITLTDSYSLIRLR